MIIAAARIATVAALQRGGVAPYPTIAGPRIYDSRKEDITDILPDDRAPVVVVRTGADTRTFQQNNMSSSRAISRTLDIQIEYGIATAYEIKDEFGVPQLVPGWPEVSSTLEAMLDLLGFQIGAALFGLSPWAAWWGRRWRKMQVNTHPIYDTSEGGNVQLAARIMTITVSAPDDCFPKPVRQGDIVNVGMSEDLAEVLDFIDANGGGDIQEAVRQLKSMLSQFPLADGGAYPALLSVRGVIPGSSGPLGQSTVAVEAELQGALPIAPP